MRSLETPLNSQQNRQASREIRSIAGRIGLSLALISGSTAASELIDDMPAHATATNPVAVVGMPFTGKWAWNGGLVQPDANGNYNDTTSSHPSVHHRYGGDWTTDLYAESGVPVKLHITSPDGPVTYSYNRSNDTCSSAGPNIAGRGITLNVLVNGTTIGTIDYEHLDNIPASSSTFVDGMTIGNVTSEPRDLSGGCYTAYHTHIELKNSASTYSCWVDKGNPGSPVNEGEAIGQLGSANTGPQQKCETNISGASNPTGRLTLINSLNAAYGKDNISPGGWHPLTGNGDALQLAAAGTQVVLINGGGNAYGADISASNLTANSAGLQALNVPKDPNTPGGIKKVVVDDKGNMMAINNCNAAYGWRNIQGTGNLQWVKMANCGDGKDVAVGNGRMALINACNGAYISDTGYAWTQILGCGDAKAIAIGETGRIMAINGSSTAYIYNPGQSSWVAKGAVGDAAKIAIGKDRIMLISSGGAAWASDIGQNNSAPMTQLTANGDATAIAVGSSDRMAIINGSGAAYASDTIVNGGSWTPESANGDAKAIAVG